ncbi:hypothetical protein I3W98_27030, partial [Streptomyces cavourensis]|nr:hypothetical protein [Streptomyces cavourensis]
MPLSAAAAMAATMTVLVAAVVPEAAASPETRREAPADRATSVALAAPAAEAEPVVDGRRRIADVHVLERDAAGL